MAKKKAVKEDSKKITFFSRNTIHCPICEGDFYKEELYRGGGRLLAGKLTDELRRLYEPSRKFGEIYPLIYILLVCPYCYYTALPSDFMQVERSREKIRKGADQRKAAIGGLFGEVDFSKSRDLAEGIASHVLAVMCYDSVERRLAPTVKQAFLSLRCAWLCNDMHRKSPNENFDFLAKLFYRKARFFYQMSIEREQKGEETLTAAGNLGPDIDKNYGYEGVLYLWGLLEYTHGSTKDPGKRVDALERIRRVIGKAHGLGKASKSKPSAILEKVKDLYDKIGKEIEDLKKES